MKHFIKIQAKENELLTHFIWSIVSFEEKMVN